MRAGEVQKLLRISAPTMYRWCKEGIISRRKLPSGSFDYSEKDVYKVLNKDVRRKTYIYARVSTGGQKKNLESQIDMLKNWSFSGGYRIDGIFADIASGISFEKRKDFFIMLDEIIDHRVEKVIIAYKDRLSRVAFDLFFHLFRQFGTEIVVVSEVGNKKLDSEEIFEEIISMLHCYSMKLYSKKRNKKLEVGLNESNTD